jgi:hypothetical protein
MCCAENGDQSQSTTTRRGSCLSVAPEAGLSGHPWPLNPEGSTTLPEALTINNNFRTE